MAIKENSKKALLHVQVGVQQLLYTMQATHVLHPAAF